MDIYAYMTAQNAAHKTFWARELAEHVGQPGADLDTLRFPLSTFAHRLRVVLSDGSTLDLHHAFFLVSERKKAVGIFSEHCGYFTFSHYDIAIYQDGQLVFKGVE